MAHRGDLPGAKHLDVTTFLVALACALAVASTAVFLAAMPLLPRLAASRDFVVYWSTGQQLVHHGNPYDAAAMGALEHSTGFSAKGSYYMRNLPWGLWLAWPLGFFSTRVASLPWSLLMLALLIASVRILWQMFGRRGSHLEWLGYCFPPGLLCVVNGQTSLLLVLGVILFLRLHRSRPFWAGAALWLCTLKPHLFLPFGFVLLAWIVVSRSYRIVLGTAAAMGAGCLLTACVDPAAWLQYAHWARTSGISSEYIPCLSVALRNLIDPRASWLAFVPSIAGCVWALVYFWPRRHAWDWLEDGSLVMLISLLVAPYCWIYDQCLALPAVLYGVCRSSSRTLLAVLASIYILIEVETFHSFWEASPWYLWIAPAWVAWFLLARASARGVQAPQASPTAAATSTG